MLFLSHLRRASRRLPCRAHFWLSRKCTMCTTSDLLKRLRSYFILCHWLDSHQISYIYLTDKNSRWLSHLLSYVSYVRGDITISRSDARKLWNICTPINSLSRMMECRGPLLLLNGSDWRTSPPFRACHFRAHHRGTLHPSWGSTLVASLFSIKNHGRNQGNGYLYFIFTNRRSARMSWRP